jgi:hypothetical protein
MRFLGIPVPVTEFKRLQLAGLRRAKALANPPKIPYYILKFLIS